jgi:hypothetical protein
MGLFRIGCRETITGLSIPGNVESEQEQVSTGAAPTIR